jgi:Ca2+-binding RTX toxin-like protein
MIQNLEPRVLLSASLSAAKVLTVTGTNGNDTISLSVANNRLVLNENGVQTGSYAGVKSIVVNALNGRDRVTVLANVAIPARIDGGNHADTLTGGSAGDVLLGQAGNDILDGNGGADALLGGKDDDILDGAAGNDYLDGQSGIDTVTYETRKAGISANLSWTTRDDEFGNRVEAYTLGKGGATGESDDYRNVDVIIATPYADTLTAIHSYNTGGYNNFGPGELLTFKMFAGDGNDTLVSQGDWNRHEIFQPTLYGGAGNDKMSFTGQSETAMLGEGGADTLTVETEGDESPGVVDGGSDIDTQIVNGTATTSAAFATYLAPNFENATLNGVREFNGNDLDNTIISYGGGNAWEQAYLNGRRGNDRIDARGFTTPVYVLGGDGNDVVFGTNYKDHLNGNAGEDALFGFNDDDTLWGGDANDYLEGGSGNDSMFGGLGNDSLRGNAGVDRFQGDEGNDVFYTRDHEQDFLYGGADSDSAQRDETEAIIDSVETTLA